MANIGDIHDCYGCGVCAVACPKNIIQIHLNKKGFYEPYITNVELCINCSLCINVCSFSNEGLALQNNILNSFAGWSNNDTIRKNCSSGGVGFEIANSLLNIGYKVCAVKYNSKKNIAEHYIASNTMELIPSIGSKYIQSYTIDGFNKINREDKYLVIGTPCQIDSFRRYIKKFKIEKNFVLIDFYCHGVPSKLIWDKYIQSVKSFVGSIVSVDWRNKLHGWHDSYAISINFEHNISSHDIKTKSTNHLYKKTHFSKLSTGDKFLNLFLGDACLGDACYENCKFKYACSSADIRLGDLWGNLYKDNEQGVSAIIVFTQKGLDTLHNSNCKLTQHSFHEVAEGQMRSMPQKTKLYNRVMTRLVNDDRASIDDFYNILKKYQQEQEWRRRLRHPVDSIYKLIKKIKK